METSTDIPAAIARYARRFHAGLGPGHQVASPLGSWLLLALCVSAGAGRTRRELTEILGVDAETASATVAALLDHPHPLIGAAAAIWNRPVGDLEALAAWLAGLPGDVQTGAMPDQSQLDAWASEHTLGLIDRFPLEVEPSTIMMLATALATRVSWQTPFEVVPADEFGSGSAWAGRVRNALATPGGHHHHRQFIAGTGRAGDVAVHTARAVSEVTERDFYGLHVTSVVAGADVPAADVLAAAHQLAIAVATDGEVAQRSLWDLPLGETPLWTLLEQTGIGGTDEVYSAVLPAWAAQSEHDLDFAGSGMPTAARAMAELLGLGRYLYETKQSAVARYSRVGFEAAAVSALAVSLGYVPSEERLRRVARLRFGHPYAVVAVATHERVIAQHRGFEPGPWHGLPVFSAWIADIQDADDGSDSG